MILHGWRVACKMPRVMATLGETILAEIMLMKTYVTFLRRSKTAADGTFWLDALTSTGDFSAVVRGFITSAEYRSRFGTP
jgi:hypothetical protein